jgi:hypothetical protein
MPGTPSKPSSWMPRSAKLSWHKIQQKVYDEAYFMPIWELGFLCASGPRVAVSGLGLISVFIYSGPYEDVRLKA